MRSPRLLLLPVIATGLALTLVGCGSSDSSSSSSSAGTAGSSADAGSSASPTRTCTADDFEVRGGFGTDPQVTVPDDCSPPTSLLTEDLVEGTGPAAKQGGTVVTNYQLTTFSDRQVLDSSFQAGREPFPVSPLGQAQVIAGWNQGLVGMKQGGRRLLVVPPDLGYGAGGNGIAPNETLVFVIDAVKVS